MGCGNYSSRCDCISPNRVSFPSAILLFAKAKKKNFLGMLPRMLKGSGPSDRSEVCYSAYTLIGMSFLDRISWGWIYHTKFLIKVELQGEKQGWMEELGRSEVG